MEELLIARLLGTVALLPFAGPRVYPGVVPDGVVIPPDGVAITLLVVDPGTEYDHDGRIGLQYARVQFDVWGLKYSAVKRASRALGHELEARRETEDVVFEEAFELNNSDEKPDRLDGGTKVFRVLMEFNMPFTLKEQ